MEADSGVDTNETGKFFSFPETRFAPVKFIYLFARGLNSENTRAHSTPTVYLF